MKESLGSPLLPLSILPLDAVSHHFLSLEYVPWEILDVR